MKLNNKFKHLGVLLLTVMMAVGCASQQKQEAAPAAEGPSASSVAIANAKAAIKKADALGYLWRDTAKILKKAEEAAKKGDEAGAVKLANTARTQAELAVKQYYLEQGIDRGLASAESSAISYNVVRGDHLWGIAGKDGIYGNPYQWPLIYKANTDKIKDADLIFPGQEFDIDTNPSDAEVGAAVSHAKTRGAWSIGTVEESDKAYLGR
jgi:nucleoid-associated protein YgaU